MDVSIKCEKSCKMDTPSKNQIARIVEFGEAEAYADLFAAAPPEWGCRVERVGSAYVLINPTLPVILFNRVIGLGVREPITDSIVANIVHMYVDGCQSIHLRFSGCTIQPRLPRRR